MLIRLFANGMLAVAAVLAVGALACAGETVVEQHTYESRQQAVEVVPEVKEHVVEERTVTHEHPVVEQRTDTVVTTTHDDDDGQDDED